jgi:Ca2+-binding RTX toxin-like protein
LPQAGDTGALSVAATGSAPHTIPTGCGGDSITAFVGGDTIQGGGDSINIMGHSAADTFAYAATSDSFNNTTGHDTVTGFAASGSISDLLDFSRLNNSSLSIGGGGEWQHDRREHHRLDQFGSQRDGLCERHGRRARL